MRVLIFEKATGKVLQITEGSEESFSGFATDTTDYIESDMSGTMYVSDGQIFQATEAPSIYHIFNYATKQWEDPRTLDDLKAVKNIEINKARLQANQSSFTYGSYQISCDALSRSDIDGINGIVTLTDAMPVDWIGFWKTADNSYVAIPDAATWTLLYSAMVAQGQTNFAHAQELKALVASATTEAELDLIVWIAT